MDELLSQLLAAVNQAPEGSPARRKAMHRLLVQLQQLPGIARSSHPNYLEALNRTWQWVSENVHLFELRQESIATSFTNWINGYLRRRIQDLYLGKPMTEMRLDEPISRDEGSTTRLDWVSSQDLAIPTLTGLEALIAQEQKQQEQRLGVRIMDYITADPDGVLRNCYPKVSSGCNCYFLSVRLLVQEPADTLTTLAQESETKYQSLVSHWKRKCLPLLQQVAKDLGYAPEQP